MPPIEQNPTQVTEKKDSKWRKVLIIVVAIIVIVAAGAAVWGIYVARYVTSEKSLYDKLESICKKGDSCCLNSVDVMRESNYKLSASGKCLDTYKPNQLLCISSLVWCEPQLSTATTSDQTANWLTYKNSDYGFEIKYPKKFLLDEKLLSLNGPFSFDTFQHEYEHGGIIPKGEMALTIFSQPAPTNLDIFIDNELGAVEKTEITVGGKNSKLVKFEGGDGPDLPGSELIAYVINGNKLWKIQLDVADFTVSTSVSDMFNQILSTFKFYDKQATTSSAQLINDLLKKVEVEGKVMQSTKFTLPVTLTDANWGLKQIICQEGGYDLTPYAGKTVNAYSYPIREKYNGIEPLTLWVLNDGQKVICAYKAVRTGSQLTPGIFPMK